MSIEDDLVATSQPHYSHLRPVLRGEFSISRARIPYFSTVLKLDEAAKELELVEQMPSDLRQKWRLEELFQREIDWDRVNKEIVNQYLRRVEKLQFFNSVTVALLPLDERGMLATAYEGGAGAPAPKPPAPYDSPNWKTLDIGGVQIVTPTAQSVHGLIRWDASRVFPATIDGQHRLAALKTLQREGHLTSANQGTTLSVLFLVLDERAGFRLDATQQINDDNPILSAVREIFIDLNRRAVEVSRARAILLDDQEVESRCVRRTLCERVGEDSKERLPLGLVHWQHNVTAKFNSGSETAPFITTVELLYAIVQDILALERPKDPFDESQIRTFVRSVEDALGTSDLVAANPARYQSHPSLMTYIEQHYIRGGETIQPFANLPSIYLRACDDGFIARWRPMLVGVLTRFEPYRAFIEQVRLRGGIDGDLAFYLTLPRRAQEQQEMAWEQKAYEKIDKPLDELAKMKTTEWPYFAVFQKGLFRASAIVLKTLGIGHRPDTLQVELAKALDSWIGFLDEMYRRGVFAVKAPLSADANDDYLWVGIALNPGSKTVRWTDATVQRIASLLLLWWHLHRSKLRRVRTFIKRLSDKKSDERFPGGRLALEAVGKAIAGALRQMDMDEDQIPKAKDRRVETLLERALATDADDDEKEEEEKDRPESTDSSAPLEEG